jgi:hypothetical protein
VSTGVLWHEDKELLERWKCSKMKLYRMRQDGRLRSVKIGGTGAWLTSDAEIARIEAPPEIVKPAPSVGPEGSGRVTKAEHPTDKRIESIPQAFPNGRAGR